MANKIEQRSVTSEIRAAKGSDFCLEGMAAKYNVLSSDLGGFREQLAPGCFKRALASGPDVKCLFNHNADAVLGRTKSGTLTLTDSKQGLMFRCQLNPASQQHRDVYEAVKRGDISECSFAFKCADGGDDFEQAEERGKPFLRRTIKNADLFDVSAVTYPAYNAPGSTNVQARSADYSIGSAAWAAEAAQLRAIDDKFETDLLRIRLDAVGREIEREKL